MDDAQETVKEDESCEEYAASLADLTFNSKPMITVLTELAEDNKNHAKIIVQLIERHLEKLPSDSKLPTMYLIDSIIKNNGQSYMALFCPNIDKLFAKVFEQVDETTRAQLFKLRQTWVGILPASKLSSLDTLVHKLDPGWPISNVNPQIHINPKFFATSVAASNITSVTVSSLSKSHTAVTKSNITSDKDEVTPELFLQKQKELIDLKQKSLEIQQTKACLDKAKGNCATVPLSTATTTTSSISRKNEPDPNHLSTQFNSILSMIDGVEKSIAGTAEEVKFKNFISSMKQTMETVKSSSEASQRHVGKQIMKKLTLLCKTLPRYDTESNNVKKQPTSVPSAVKSVTISRTPPTLISRTPSTSIKTHSIHPLTILNTSASSKPHPTSNTASAVTTSSHLPLRIAPVSSELINAVQRVRDPRLRKNELNQCKFDSKTSAVIQEQKSADVDVLMSGISDKKANETVGNIENVPLAHTSSTKATIAALFENRPKKSNATEQRKSNTSVPAKASHDHVEKVKVKVAINKPKGSNVTSKKLVDPRPARFQDRLSNSESSEGIKSDKNKTPGKVCTSALSTEKQILSLFLNDNDMKNDNLAVEKKEKSDFKIDLNEMKQLSEKDKRLAIVKALSAEVMKLNTNGNSNIPPAPEGLTKLSELLVKGNVKDKIRATNSTQDECKTQHKEQLKGILGVIPKTTQKRLSGNTDELDVPYKKNKTNVSKPTSMSTDEGTAALATIVNLNPELSLQSNIDKDCAYKRDTVDNKYKENKRDKVHRSQTMKKEVTNKQFESKYENAQDQKDKLDRWHSKMNRVKSYVGARKGQKYINSNLPYQEPYRENGRQNKYPVTQSNKVKDTLDHSNEEHILGKMNDNEYNISMKQDEMEQAKRLDVEKNNAVSSNKINSMTTVATELCKDNSNEQSESTILKQLASKTNEDISEDTTESSDIPEQLMKPSSIQNMEFKMNEKEHNVVNLKDSRVKISEQLETNTLPDESSKVSTVNEPHISGEQIKKTDAECHTEELSVEWGKPVGSNLTNARDNVSYINELILEEPMDIADSQIPIPETSVFSNLDTNNFINQDTDHQSTEGSSQDKMAIDTVPNILENNSICLNTMFLVKPDSSLGIIGHTQLNNDQSSSLLNNFTTDNMDGISKTMEIQVSAPPNTLINSDHLDFKNEIDKKPLVAGIITDNLSLPNEIVDNKCVTNIEHIVCEQNVAKENPNIDAEDINGGVGIDKHRDSSKNQSMKANIDITPKIVNTADTFTDILETCSPIVSSESDDEEFSDKIEMEENSSTDNFRPGIKTPPPPNISGNNIYIPNIRTPPPPHIVGDEFISSNKDDIRNVFSNSEVIPKNVTMNTIAQSNNKLVMEPSQNPTSLCEPPLLPVSLSKLTSTSTFLSDSQLCPLSSSGPPLLTTSLPEAQLSSPSISSPMLPPISLSEPVLASVSLSEPPPLHVSLSEPPLPPVSLSEPPLPPASLSESPLPPASLSEPPLPPTSLSEPPLPTASLSEPPLPPASLSEPPLPPASLSEPPLPPASLSEPPLPPASLSEPLCTTVSLSEPPRPSVSLSDSNPFGLSDRVLTGDKTSIGSETNIGSSMDIDYRHVFYQFSACQPLPEHGATELSVTKKEDIDLRTVSSLNNMINVVGGSEIDEEMNYMKRKRRRTDSVGSSSSDHSSDYDKHSSSHSNTMSSPDRESTNLSRASPADMKISSPMDLGMIPPPPVDSDAAPSLNTTHTAAALLSSLPPPPVPPFTSSLQQNSNIPITCSVLPTFNSTIPERLTLPPPPPPIPPPVEYALSHNKIPEIPPTDSNTLKMIEEDTTLAINIDRVPKEIRYYGNTAVIFLNWDNPREISFYNGVRNCIIDDRYVVPFTLNAPDKEVILDGATYRMRLGAPTREIYINGKGYQCQFNQVPVLIDFGIKSYLVKLEGPPPPVNISSAQRLDLVAGKIYIIIDAKQHIPIFLDPKPQKIDVDGIPLVLQFADNLKRVLINNQPFTANYGGLPQSFSIFGKVHYFRLSILPSHTQLGFTNIKNMIQTRLPSPPPIPALLCDASYNQASVSEMQPPHFTSGSFASSVISNTVSPVSSTTTSTASSQISSLPPPPFELKSTEMPTLDLLMNLLPTVQPAATEATNSSAGNQSESSVSIPNVGSLTIDELFQKLVASGIVPGSQNDEDVIIKEPDLNKPESLKQQQPALVEELYSGTQCGSCGLRFPGDLMDKYSQHLDWHFRHNRKDKGTGSMIHSRKWFYPVTDWIEFEQESDVDDRAVSWFETQLVESSEDTNEKILTIPAGEDAENAICELCQDKFEQFYNEEQEEWHLKNAIRIEDHIYHPICFEGFKEKPVESEIVDLDEPEEDNRNNNDINAMEDTNANVELETDKDVIEIKVKEEKIDLCNVDDNTVSQPENPTICSKENATRDNLENNAEKENDSDVEEVEVIEQPVVHIVIPDDIEQELNLETLNMDEIIAVKSQTTEIIETVEEDSPVITIADIDRVDITHSDVACSIDGNIEMDDTPQQVLGGSKIKINITKPAMPESPLPDISNDVPSPDDICISSEEQPIIITSIISDEPPPPGEETIIERKPRLADKILTEYPPVKKGNELSGLCSIM